MNTRNDKNEDRALAIIQGWAQTAAHKAGATVQFFMTQMNYRSLVPVLRGLMSPKAMCQSCGHPFINELDIQIDHYYPPRHPQDWERLHARNLWMICTFCDTPKAQSHSMFGLKEQEKARLKMLRS